MDATDESKRKPRRTRGTPSYYYRNRFAYACIATGTALFAAWTFTPIFRQVNEKLRKSWLQRTQEEIDRRYLFTLSTPRTKQQIQKTLDENEQLMDER